MTTVMAYFIFWTFLGTVLYGLDRKYGTRIYRKYYGLTHKEPLGDSVVLGFVYKRSSKTKTAVAAILALITSFLASVYGEQKFSPYMELIHWAINTLAIMLSFYLSPYILSLWQKKEKVFDTADKIERGEMEMPDVTESISGKMKSIKKMFAWLAGKRNDSSSATNDKLSQDPTPADSIKRPKMTAKEIFDSVPRLGEGVINGRKPSDRQ